MKNKEDKENADIRAMRFQPKVGPGKNKFDASLAERSSRWAEKRREKMKRKREEIRKQEDEYCSFRPKIVRD